ncbi:hypothetical protein ACLOJK_028506 [Asimina triloba]
MRAKAYEKAEILAKLLQQELQSHKKNEPRRRWSVMIRSSNLKGRSRSCQNSTSDLVDRSGENREVVIGIDKVVVVCRPCGKTKVWIKGRKSSGESRECQPSEKVIGVNKAMGVESAGLTERPEALIKGTNKGAGGVATMWEGRDANGAVTVEVVALREGQGWKAREADENGPDKVQQATRDTDEMHDLRECADMMELRWSDDNGNGAGILVRSRSDNNMNEVSSLECHCNGPIRSIVGGLMDNRSTDKAIRVDEAMKDDLGVMLRNVIRVSKPGNNDNECKMKHSFVGK